MLLDSNQNTITNTNTGVSRQNSTKVTTRDDTYQQQKQNDGGDHSKQPQPYMVPISNSNSFDQLASQQQGGVLNRMGSALGVQLQSHASLV